MRYVAFLRAINVAGHARVRIDDLQAAFVSAGCGADTTYLQSGNALFEVPEDKREPTFARVHHNVKERLGTEPVIFFRHREKRW